MSRELGYGSTIGLTVIASKSQPKLYQKFTDPQSDAYSIGSSGKKKGLSFSIAFGDTTPLKLPVFEIR